MAEVVIQLQNAPASPVWQPDHHEVHDGHGDGGFADGPGAHGALPVGYSEPAHWPLGFTSSLPLLRNPENFSLFFWLFTRVPDTFFWMIVALLFFAGQLIQFKYTDFFKELKEKGTLKQWPFIGFATGIILLLYFYFVHRIRIWGINLVGNLSPVWRIRVRNFFNPSGIVSRVGGVVVGAAIGVSYIRLAERNFHYVYFLLFLVGCFFPMILTLRPPTDFNAINGLFVSLIIHSFRIMWAATTSDHGGSGSVNSMVDGIVISVVVLIAASMRHYFESRAVVEDVARANREAEAANNVNQQEEEEEEEEEANN